MWEQKESYDGVVNLANPHDAGNTYDFTEVSGNRIGASFLGLLNGEALYGVEDQPGFAGHKDWRLPTVGELKGIVDTTVSYGPSLPCGGGYYTPCIRQSVFGPTVHCFDTFYDECRYIAGTVDRGPSGSHASLAVNFENGYGFITTGAPNAARAVRGGGE
jgi:hypothetical protein